jgi:hypothetical protein
MWCVALHVCSLQAVGAIRTADLGNAVRVSSLIHLCPACATISLFGWSDREFFATCCDLCECE